MMVFTHFRKYKELGYELHLPQMLDDLAVSVCLVLHSPIKQLYKNDINDSLLQNEESLSKNKTISYSSFDDSGCGILVQSGMRFFFLFGELFFYHVKLSLDFILNEETITNYFGTVLDLRWAYEWVTAFKE